MTKRSSNNASLRLEGKELSTFVGNAGFFSECSDIGLLVMNKSINRDKVNFSVRKGEFECLIDKVNFLLSDSEKYKQKSGKEFESLERLREYFETEYARQYS